MGDDDEGVYQIGAEAIGMGGFLSGAVRWVHGGASDKNQSDDELDQRDSATSDDTRVDPLANYAPIF